MKKIALVFICICITTGSFSQTVLTYGTNAVTKDEFERAFNKNPNLTGDRKKALREYLDLYINFKLKVQSAYDAGLHKDPTQQYELQNFRRQLAENIINEEANARELVQEAFDRSQKEIHLAQVFIEVNPGADTAEAYKKIHAAYNELKAGKDFGTVAGEFSNDETTRQTKGDLGYITVFTLPYHLENIAYTLKTNSFSAPVKTQMGYHIFKNVGEKKASGSRRVAQILVSYPPNASAEDQNVAAKKADSLYNLLKSGSNFGELAQSVSNDLSSSNNKGELPEFTAGTYSAEFEEVAFSLQNAGDIAKPFRTSYGYHILQLLEAKPVATDINDGANFASLQERVSKEGRMDKAKKELILKKLPLLKYKPAVINQPALLRFTDSALVSLTAGAVSGINENTLLFSFAKQNVKAADWVQFAKAARSNPAQYPANSLPDLYKEFIRVSADECYRNNLEAYNAGFARQVKEFKEANLLFAVMEKNVWGKANEDTAGLHKYYKLHKTKYIWSPSADAIIVTCNNQQLANEVQQKLKDNVGNWRAITTSMGSDVMADSSRFELGQLPVVDRTNFTEGLITAPAKNETDGTITFNYVLKMYNEPGERSFEDARGLVINDYQQVLEDRWVQQLKKKYPVKINEAVFATIK